jgi:hypothetical protein
MGESKIETRVLQREIAMNHVQERWYRKTYIDVTEPENEYVESIIATSHNEAMQLAFNTKEPQHQIMSVELVGSMQEYERYEKAKEVAQKIFQKGEEP